MQCRHDFGCEVLILGIQIQARFKEKLDFFQIEVADVTKIRPIFTK